MSFRLIPISSMPCPENISNMGPAWACTSSSIGRSSSLPARSWARSFSRVASREASGETSSSVPLDERLARRAGAAGGRAAAPRPGSRPAPAPRPAISAFTMVDGELGQVADHRLDVAADVADLGVLGGLDLEERRLGELGQPAGDLGLPHPGGPDHDDVLRRDLVAQLRPAGSAAASGCGARWPPRAWPAAGRRCSGRARRRSGRA